MSALVDVLSKFRTQLANCYWWQRLADPDSPWDVATALEHIYLEGLPPASPGPDHTKAELETLWPFAIVWHETAGGVRFQVPSQPGCCVLPSGILICQIEIPVNPDIADDPTAIALDLHQRYDRIIQNSAAQPGLLDLSGQAGYVAINDLTVYGYHRTDPKDVADLGDVTIGQLQITWGLNA